MATTRLNSLFSQCQEFVEDEKLNDENWSIRASLQFVACVLSTARVVGRCSLSARLSRLVYLCHLRPFHRLFSNCTFSSRFSHWPITFFFFFYLNMSFTFLLIPFTDRRLPSSFRLSILCNPLLSLLCASSFGFVIFVVKKLKCE